MPQTEEGRSCSGCKKTIPDLRGKSPEELLALYAANKGSLCGIFTQDQVELTPTRESVRMPTVQRISRQLRVFLITLLAVFGFLVAGAPKALAQNFEKDQHGKVIPQQKSVLMGKVFEQEFDELQPIELATVVLFEDGYIVTGANTDSLGNYKIVFPQALDPTKRYALRCSYGGREEMIEDIKLIMGVGIFDFEMNFTPGRLRGAVCGIISVPDFKMESMPSRTNLLSTPNGHTLDRDYYNNLYSF